MYIAHCGFRERHCGNLCFLCEAECAVLYIDSVSIVLIGAVLL